MAHRIGDWLLRLKVSRRFEAVTVVSQGVMAISFIWALIEGWGRVPGFVIVPFGIAVVVVITAGLAAIVEPYPDEQK